MLMVFWILYLIGGTVFFYNTLSANKKSKLMNTSFWGFTNIVSGFYLIIIGEAIWIFCWITGVLLSPSSLTLSLGIFPLLMPVLTFGSLLLIKVKEQKRSNNKELKKAVRPRIEKWAKGLPSDIKVQSVLYALDTHRDIISGRVTVHLKGRNVPDKVNWSEYGISLEQKIKHPIIVKIILNNDIVYP